MHTDGKRLWYILIQKDSKVLYRAKRIIGFGKIYKIEKVLVGQKQKEDSTFLAKKYIYFRLVITKREEIKKLLQAFNGQFFCRSRKIQFSR